jgi:hypothetical protein
MVVQRMEQHGVEGNVKLYNSLMDLVAKSALFGFAGPLDGYGVLRRMREGGVSPTVVTFNALLEVRVPPSCAAQLGPPLQFEPASRRVIRRLPRTTAVPARSSARHPPRPVS